MQQKRIGKAISAEVLRRLAVEDDHGRELVREAVEGKVATAPPPVGPTAPESQPLVLGGPDYEPIVRGKTKPPLTPKQHQVVKTLWDAPGHTMTGERLRVASVCADAVQVLGRIKALDPDWGSIIHFPGRGRKGYRIG